MKTTTFAAFLAALLTLAAIGAACVPLCPCGNWGDWKVGRCGPHDDCCQQFIVWHRHGERVCPPEPNLPVTPVTIDTFKPFSVWGNDACPGPMNGPVVAVLGRHDIPFVVLAGHYASRFDALEMSTFGGEWLSDGFWGAIRCDRGYGGMPVVTMANPQRAVFIRAAKASRTETSLPMTITLSDNEGGVLYSATTVEGTIEATVVLAH